MGEKPRLILLIKLTFMTLKQNVKNFVLLVFLLGMTITTFAQKGSISGNISDAEGPLIGATVLVKGTGIGTSTDIDGNFTININPGTYDFEASYIGYGSQIIEVTVSEGGVGTANFNLSEGINFDEIIITGTRASARTDTDAPVPIDIINMDKLMAAAPQTNLNQILHYAAPSFSSNTQTISDGTDHIDPASLRGLGPDQVLVLINGKRRHNSSLVNVNGTFGRGNVGTDLNAIPAAAIDKIEVLRDGAAAQYGSDAIAGVINLRLRDDVNALNVTMNTGANFTSEIGAFEGETKSYDGETVDLGLNFGLPLGNSGGYINLTGQLDFRGSTNRMQEFTGSIFNAYNTIERIARGRNMDVSNLNQSQISSLAGDAGVFNQSELDWLNNTTFLNTSSAYTEFEALAEQNGLAINDDNLADLRGLLSQIGYLSNDQITSISDVTTASDFSDNLKETSTPLSKNVTDSELAARELERSDFNMRVGQSAVRGGKFFANMSLPLGENMEFYGFGGMSYRNGESGCFYRLPNQSRTSTSIYPNGTVPRINSNIVDQSIGGGIRGYIGNWDIDFSNVYGSNQFLFNMTETHNATIGSSSPTSFSAGGHSFAQNTSNFDVSQYLEMDGINGLNVAFGAEYRYENFQVIPGTEQSYGNYDVNGILVNPITPGAQLSKDILGRNRPAGAQCFAGFLPTNEIDANRSSAAGYLDLEADITDAFLLGGAVRYENYSDFGGTFTYKLAGRYKIMDNFALRGAVSTGFRAPSLHQIHFSRTSTIFELVDGVSVPFERGTFANTSRAAKLLGIPELKQETSQNFSIGATFKAPESGFRFTVDAYQVAIDDRVVLTGNFSPGDDVELQSIFEQAGATGATFFSNAINTTSQGLDLVISYNLSLGDGMSLDNALAATFSQTTWNQDEGINASPILEEKNLVGTYFDQTSRIYLEQGVPRTKITLSNSFNMGKLDIYLRNTYFGQTTEATNEEIFDNDLNLLEGATIDPYNDPKVITDLSVGYSVSNNLRLTVGANNLLDIYPDIVDDAFKSSGRFIYSRRAPQFSFGGRYAFARLAFTLR